MDQLPQNLRSELYIKDDDYIQSYSHGNFITLTNITARDIDKIIKFRIEPLHISLHSFNSKVRSLIFGNTKSDQAVKNFEMLDANGIRSNIQIVLCPGINDGQDLKNTLDIITGRYKNILSVGIVPVGITKLNGSSRLEPFNRFSSRLVLEFIDNYRRINYRNRIASKIFPADEFFIIAGELFPDYRYYGRFLQIKNGIGKTVNFFNEITSSLRNFISTGDGRTVNFLNHKKRILLVTSEYGKYIFNYASAFIKTIPGVFPEFKLEALIDILKVKNTFFGGNVKVTGLLAGNDIICELEARNLKKYEKILIPDCIFNSEEITLDNISRRMINNISNKIKFIKEDGRALIKELFN